MRVMGGRKGGREGGRVESVQWPEERVRVRVNPNLDGSLGRRALTAQAGGWQRQTGDKYRYIRSTRKGERGRRTRRTRRRTRRRRRRTRRRRKRRRRTRKRRTRTKRTRRRRKRRLILGYIFTYFTSFTAPPIITITAHKSNPYYFCAHTPSLRPSTLLLLLLDLPPFQPNPYHALHRP